MKYSRFELLALSVGSVSVAGAVLASLRGGLVVEEIVAQALLLAVLVGAVHWGRKVGTVTAALATLAYVLMRAPLLTRDGLSTDVVGLLVIRMLTYGVVGIAGGELCSRVRYLLARLESTSNIDESTGLFKERFITAMLRSMIGQYERYQKTFSVVTLSLLDPSMTSTRRIEPRSLLRAVATQIRGDLRLVDDVAHLDDGRFLLVLPHTGKAGAQIAANRVSEGVRRLVSANAEWVRADVFGADEDLGDIKRLCGTGTGPDENSEPFEAAA